MPRIIEHPMPFDDSQLGMILDASAPSTSVGVEEKLRRIDQFLGMQDGLKWFNWLYLAIAETVNASLTAGKWNDPEFLQRLDIRFAQLYFDALRNYLAGKQCPGCWKVLFRRRADIRVARVQFAIAGVNAHINHDLPQALLETAAETGRVIAHGSPQYADFTALNSVLDSVIVPAEDTLKIRLNGAQISNLANIEERLAGWSVSAAREAAWTNGEVLAALGAGTVLAKQFLSTLNGLAEVANTALLVAPP
jgi:hypothetical protein